MMSVDRTQPHSESDQDDADADSPVAVPAPQSWDLPVRNDEKAWRIIEEHSAELDLPISVLASSIDLFTKMYSECDTVGRGILAGVAASVRVACQNTNSRDHYVKSQPYQALIQLRSLGKQANCVGELVYTARQ